MSSIAYKHFPTSLIQVMRLLLLFVLLLSGTTSSAEQSPLYLEVSHSHTGEVFHTSEVQTGAIIRLRWIHSVELTPWEEYYQVLETGKLLLKKTRFQSYGAGVPEYGGEFIKEQGWMVHDNINRLLPALGWIHSHSAGFQIDVNSKVLLSPDSLPHHEPLKLSIGYK